MNKDYNSRISAKLFVGEWEFSYETWQTWTFFHYESCLRVYPIFGVLGAFLHIEGHSMPNLENHRSERRSFPMKLGKHGLFFHYESFVPGGFGLWWAICFVFREGGSAKGISTTVSV